jgi:divalent metal cation (Fe/Co/Zn/Cd) transporter
MPGRGHLLRAEALEEDLPQSPAHRLRHSLERRARLLECATTAWNSFEAFVTIAAGLASDSVGLVAFGLDSCVEVFASLVVLWQLRRSGDARRTRRAMRLIAAAFFFLAGYLAVHGVRTLIVGQEPSPSWIGLAFLAVTVVVMVLLAWGKRTTGRRLGNEPMVANAEMTLLDGGLAAATLVAVFIAVETRLHWVDPVAAALVAVLALGLGRRAWRSVSRVALSG